MIQPRAFQCECGKVKPHQSAKCWACLLAAADAERQEFLKEQAIRREVERFGGVYRGPEVR